MSLQQDLQDGAEIDAFCERRLAEILTSARSDIRRLLDQASATRTCDQLRLALAALDRAGPVS